MVTQGSRIILLSGSPLPDSLDWSEECLSNVLLPTFVEIWGANATSASTDDSPAWRSLDLEASHLPTGLTQMSREDDRHGNTYENVVQPVLADQGPAFLTATDKAKWSQVSSSTHSTASGSQAASQYYEQSFAAHEDIQSSQILEAEPTDETSFLSPSGTTSFESDISNFHSQKQLARARLYSAYISDLNEIPNASYLNSMVPQTMTTNLVVGIISISQPRAITTRKGNRVVELVELIVGDDTRAGFGINIWMSPAPLKFANAARAVDSNNLRDQVLRLRPRDVILARRIALSSFRGKVYGQSLRRGMTTVDLLLRNVVDVYDARGAFRVKEVEANVEESGQLDKAKRVMGWVQRFVGSVVVRETSTTKRITRTHTDKTSLPALPSDTP